MRVAVATRYGHAVGGIETYLESVVPALASRGHELLVCHDRSLDSNQRRIFSPGLATVSGGGAFEAVSAFRPDVVFSHGMSCAATERRLLEIGPFVVLLHAYDGTCISGSKCHGFPSPQVCDRPLGPGCLVRYLPRRCGGLSPLTMMSSYREQVQRRQTLREAAALVTLSEHMRREALAQGVTPARAHNLPAFVPSAERFSTLASASRIRGSRRPHVVFLGRLEPLKGGTLLIEALGRLDPSLRTAIQVTIAGDGRDRARCEEAARQHSPAGANIRFTGWLSPASTAELLSTADLLVMPSIWPEPLGLVGLEAAAAGVPALAFTVGGIPQWLEDGVTGMLIHGQPSAERLAVAISTCLADPVRLAGWGRTAADRAAVLTVQHHVQALESVFDAAVAINRGAAR